MNNTCFNCKTTPALADLNDYWPDDQPKPIRLCDDCMKEQQRVEAEADQLAALPSCDFRQMLIDRAETVGQLVNLLKAHDQAECFSCASTRKAVQSDRLYLNPAAVCCEQGVA
jgi:hypothetical protein